MQVGHFGEFWTTLLNALRTTLKTTTKIILLAHIPFQVSRQRLAIPFPKFQGCTWQNLFQSFKAAHGNTFSKYEAAPDKTSRLHLTNPFSKSKSEQRQTLDFMNIHFSTCFYHTKLLSQKNQFSIGTNKTTHEFIAKRIFINLTKLHIKNTFEMSIKKRGWNRFFIQLILNHF